MRLPQHLKPLFVSTAIGAVFSGIYGLAQPKWMSRIVPAGALTGAIIFFWTQLLGSLFDPKIDRLSPRLQAFAKGLVFLLAGVLGWISGMLAARLLFGVGWRLEWIFGGEGLIVMSIIGGIAVVVGLSFYAFDLLKMRLERTLERLKQREWAEKELELARAIQTRLLPPQLVEGDGFRITARNLPAHLVAGDFYDIVRLDDGSVVIVAADVAGKGIVASLIMASVKAVLPFVAHEGAQHAMSMLNAKLVQELGRHEFVALAYARFTPSDGSVELLNAGFPEPYLVTSDSVRALATTGERFPLGVKSDVVYEPLMTRIAPGERLVFVSDGIPEAPVNGEPLGYERVAEMLGRAATLDAFIEDVRSVVGDVLEDDWTAVMVERR